MKAAGVVVALAVLVVAGGPLQQPAAPPGLVRAGEYRQSMAGAAAPAVTEGSVYDVGPFPLSTPDLPPGEGRDATVAMCSVCHSVRYLTMQPTLPPETWQATVRKMIDVHGAPIPDDVAQRITGYLQQKGRAPGAGATGLSFMKTVRPGPVNPER